MKSFSKNADGYTLRSYYGRAKKVVIPKHHLFKPVTAIGERAFADCENLTSIVIPNSVTIIGDGAFEFCSSLTSIKIPSSVTTMGNFAIDGGINCVIYCEEQSQPAGWDERWNYSQRLVIWGHKQGN